MRTTFNDKRGGVKFLHFLGEFLREKRSQDGIASTGMRKLEV
jgi:hypothetical protein